jgi:N-methylhydantoinase A
VQRNWNVSIDAGGTFTDAVARSRDGQILVAKAPSTPHDPAEGLTNTMTELVRVGMPLDDVALICHGTTVATNATLVGTWARVVLVTTAGFRDVIAYRQGSRPDVYSLTPERPNALVARGDRLEVAERIDARGKVLTALTSEEVERVVAQVVARAPESVAVSLLFSYLDDRHERMLGEALRDALPDTPITLSSEVAREFREYPRTATTVINAALRPIVGGYLERAAGAVAAMGVDAPFLVMQSNGGSVPAPRADADAHRLILSGPAGGVTGLIDISRRHGLDKTISLDMGGTSTDVCLVRDGVAPMTSSQRIGDHELLASTVDIHTIGAGGGSIAWVDPTGRLRVGPRSAKAVPGPASYGRGGTEPTLTDAHVVLGTLGSVALASDMTLDREAAERALATVGGPIGKTPVEAAEAIIAISVAHMIRALRKVSVERGLDPREFTLVPFGGAGPLHAGLLLRHLRLRSVLVPRRPGLFSAEGLLAAGLRIDDSQTVLRLHQEGDAADLLDWFAQRAEQLTAQLAHDGVDEDDVTVTASVDCRYLGQGFELNVPLTNLSAEGLAQLPHAFGNLHEARYGHANRDEPVELVTLRISALGTYAEAIDEQVGAGGAAPEPAALLATRDVVMPGSGEPAETPVWDRARLRADNVLTGPAIVHQMDSTTLVLAGQRATVTASGDIELTEEAR